LVDIGRLLFLFFILFFGDGNKGGDLPRGDQKAMESCRQCDSKQHQLSLAKSRSSPSSQGTRRGF